MARPRPATPSSCAGLGLLLTANVAAAPPDRVLEAASPRILEQLASTGRRSASAASVVAGTAVERLFPARARPTPAEPARLAILPVLRGARADLTIGAAFEGLERASAFRPLRPTSIDDYFFQDGKELSARALACGGDTDCLSAELAVFRADLGLVLIGNAEVQPPLLGLVLIDSARERVLAERYETLTGAPFAEQVRAQVDALFDDAGLLRSGQLELIVEPSGARVEVAGGLEPDPNAAHRYTLAPGEHPVRISAPGHEPVERTVTVRPGEVTRVDLRLEPEGSFWSSPWVWAGLATVVVGTGATVGILAAGGDRDCLCLEGPGERECIVCTP
jgi:hypothetical protein